MKLPLILALLFGFVANEMDLDQDWGVCEAAEDDDDVIQQESSGHNDLDQQRKRAMLRMRRPRPIVSFEPREPREEIRAELARRVVFQQKYQARLAQIMAGAEGQLSPTVQAELNRLAGQAAYEELRRRRFDKEWPGIYKTPAERQAAYAALNPLTWAAS
jgi:hypothetical protein